MKVWEQVLEFIDTIVSCAYMKLLCQREAASAEAVALMLAKEDGGFPLYELGKVDHTDIGRYASAQQRARAHVAEQS